MPFTISHAAAVLPFARPLARWRLLSAAVIGSMVPDFGWFLPWRPARFETHSLRCAADLLPAGRPRDLLAVPAADPDADPGVAAAGRLCALAVVRGARRTIRASSNGCWAACGVLAGRDHPSRLGRLHPRGRRAECACFPVLEEPVGRDRRPSAHRGALAAGRELPDRADRRGRWWSLYGLRPGQAASWPCRAGCSGRERAAGSAAYRAHGRGLERHVLCLGIVQTPPGGAAPAAIVRLERRRRSPSCAECARCAGPR